MNRYKELIKNMGLLTIGNFASKILSFLLVPLYTNVLSTQEYGTFDIIITTISLLLPILTINIVEAVLRFPLDKQNDQSYLEDVFTVGLRNTLIGCFVLIFLLGINHTFCLIPALTQYEKYMLLLFIVQAFNQLLLNFARATDHVKEVAIAGVLTSVVMIGLNIWLLLFVRIGLKGYFWSVILANLVADIYYIVKLRAFHYSRLTLSYPSITREMVVYSFPMIFNTVGWWINNTSDRYIVTWLCGLSANGIYSVAYKLPSILNVFHSIFTQAWIISAVQAYKTDRNIGFFRNVYNTYGGLMTVLCSGLIMFTKPVAYILFRKEFFLAWQYCPWLLIAVVFGTLSGVLGGVFSAEKDSKMFAISTCIGAALNIMLNIVLVRPFGPLGAALATAFSAYVVWIVRVKHTRKYVDLRLRLGRDHIIYLLLITQSVLLLLIKRMVLYYSLSFAALVLILVLYKKEFGKLYLKAKESLVDHGF